MRHARSIPDKKAGPGCLAHFLPVIGFQPGTKTIPPMGGFPGSLAGAHALGLLALLRSYPRFREKVLNQPLLAEALFSTSALHSKFMKVNHQSLTNIFLPITGQKPK